MDKLALSRSSALVCGPALVVLGVGGCVAAFFGLPWVAAALLLAFLLALCARVWAKLSGRRLSLSVVSAVDGLFPGDTAEIELEVRNEKFLPVIWMELFFPLAPTLCLVPEGSRKPEDWELADLADQKASDRLVGEQRLSLLLWYETTRVTTRWIAHRRGAYSMAGWRLRTGDGFGLAQVEGPVPQDQAQRFLVYPARTEVSPALFLRNLWNADTGARGVMEDPTVIRSTRDYQTTDSVRRINWRLAARGLPLSVNVYEDILPRSVHFLFDGESFSGPDAHPKEMEDALSILGSELLCLEEASVRCGLSLCRGSAGPAGNLFAPADLSALLGALAVYEPMPDEWDADIEHILPQKPVFDSAPLLEAEHRVGRFYYIAYDTDCLKDRWLLLRLGGERTTILTWKEPEPFGEFEVVALGRLRKGGGEHG